MWKLGWQEEEPQASWSKRGRPLDDTGSNWLVSHEVRASGSRH